MSNYGRSLLLAIFNFLALCSTLALAAPIQGSYDLAVRQPKGTIVMDKRYDGARFTYYDAGENACGGRDSNTDYVSSALSAASTVVLTSRNYDR